MIADYCLNSWNYLNIYFAQLYGLTMIEETSLKAALDMKTYIVRLVSLQKWPMCSRTGYKCQILHTNSLGYSKYHVLRPPKMFRPEYNLP